MECNKEEAIRVREMAKGMMEQRDFTSAHRFVLKAQKLYSELDSLSQMLTICDVHCAAGSKLFGNEKDWYGILQVSQTADEATIKKQYRKFALMLHPDKNKFPGAEAAFKLIGEAQGTLLDRGKRSLHDAKRRAAPTYCPPQSTNYQTHSAFQNNVPKTSTQSRPADKSTQAPLNGYPTFWTVCRSCGMRYQYYRVAINKQLQCQNCKMKFIAVEISGPSKRNSSHEPFPQGPTVHTHNSSSVPQRSTTMNQSSSVDLKHSKSAGSCSYGNESSFKAGSVSGAAADKANRKRKRQKASESCESSDSSSETDSEYDEGMSETVEIHPAQGLGSQVEQNPRRSGRAKRNVSYKENQSDDDDDEERVKTKMHEPFHSEDKKGGVVPENKVRSGRKGTGWTERPDKKERGSPNGIFDTSKLKSKDHNNKSSEQDDSKMELGSDSAAQPGLFVCPDPDFNDFDKAKEEGSFEVGQLWAVYDTVDGMPRFYALIKRVFARSHSFKLKITWLEPKPDNENEIQWVQEELPVSCGKFKTGDTQDTQDRLMFSHLMCWDKGPRRNTYEITPRKGETWGIFKNWDISWGFDSNSHQSYEYEFVIVLSSYSETDGVSVAYLSKVKGFASVFCRKVRDGTDVFQIQPCDLYRFSHMVPSFELTGKEREDVPEGSYELDPAAVPQNLEEIDIPNKPKAESAESFLDKSCSMSSPAEAKLTSKLKGVKRKHQVVLDSDDDDDVMVDDGNRNFSRRFEVSEPEFYNFDANKSKEKFRSGQVWSLYSDEECLPKYYAQIRRIQLEPEFELRISWLEPCSFFDDVIQWHDKRMPVCCGRFKIKPGAPETYNISEPFSHQLAAEPAGQRDEFNIFPNIGDIWALYRNWSAGLKFSELELCEYDVVEIMAINDAIIEVLLLEPVDGFKSVFRNLSSKDGSLVTRVFPRSELLRFSHQIPAFRLTDERQGSLRGCVELDPAALPVHFFS